MTKQKRTKRDHEGGYARNDLTREQEEEARLLIDNIGGDTWNEGDYDWRFTGVRCDFGTQSCSMDITVSDHDTGTGEPRRRFQRSGNVYGVTGYDEMVEGPEQNRRLQPDFYTKVADLVEYLEKTIPRS
jgi:hypothetical protein